jgi:hypothetical protein
VSDSPTSADRAVSFGPFRLLPAQQLLLEGETPVRLGSRALEILIARVERAGELASAGYRAKPSLINQPPSRPWTMAGGQNLPLKIGGHPTPASKRWIKQIGRCRSVTVINHA